MTTFRGPPPETEVGIGALTLSGFILEVTRRHPDREAVVFHEPDGGVLRWSYRDLEREAPSWHAPCSAPGRGRTAGSGS